MMVSSAYFSMEKLFRVVVIVSAYRENRMGERTHPCGELADVIAGVDTIHVYDAFPSLAFFVLIPQCTMYICKIQADSVLKLQIGIVFLV